MREEQKLEYQNFLNNLIFAYDNYLLDNEASSDSTDDEKSALLSQLINMYNINSQNQLDVTYSSSLTEALGKLFDEFSKYVKQKSEIATVEKQHIGKFDKILKLHSQRNISLRKKLFPRVQTKLAKLKKVDLDYLDITKKLTNENTHSDILAALIDRDRCPGICSTFLANLLNASLHHSRNFDRTVELNSGRQVRLADVVNKMVKLLEAGKLYPTCLREKSIDDGMRIDILIKSRIAYIAIENKVQSSEHDAQTVEYYKWLKLNCVGNIVPVGILLSPTRMSPICNHFGILGYEDVKWSLVNALNGKNLNNDEYLLGRSYLNSLEHLLI
jgi:hypothetical protein